MNDEPKVYVFATILDPRPRNISKLPKPRFHSADFLILLVVVATVLMLVFG
jgi:hypothetical protein